MEELYNALKEFLLNQFNSALPEYEDEEATLPALTDKQVVFGVIDPLKYTQNVVVSILPETQETGESTLSDYTIESAFTVTFVCKNDRYDTLVKRMCRYAACFKNTLAKEYTLNGAADNSETGTIKFYSDCGTVEKQMTAAEISLNIYNSEEY